MTVRISDKLSLPIEVLTSTVGILGIRGSGKTNTAGVIVEEATRLGIPSSVADPTGAWWGIKSSADGKSPGLPFYVFGGEHADVPLEPETGEIMARFAVERRVPTVLDLSLMTKGRQLHFMANYAAALYHANREAFLQVIDETARFCPQTIRGSDVDASKCLGAVQDLGALGRVKGLGLVIVGQRAAKINKDVLTQCHTLIVHQTNSPQDKKAVDDWIGEQYGKGPERDRFLTELPRLNRGEAFVWSPTFDIFQRVQIRARTTFDSSKTPEIGKRAIGPKVFASVDLEALSAELQAAKQRAVENDPKALKRTIADLKKQIGSAPAAVETKIERVEVPVLPESTASELREIAKGIGNLLDRFVGVTDQIQGALSRIQRPASVVVPPPRATRQPPVQRTAAPRSAAPSDFSLGKGERTTMIAVAQYPEGVGRDQLSVLTGYKRSSRDANVQRLKAAGYVETSGGLIKPTQIGIDALGTDYEPLPIGDELREYWLQRLPGGERAVLQVLIEAFPKMVDRASIDDATGYKRSSRDACIQRLKSRRLVEVSGGGVRASETLFSYA